MSYSKINLSCSTSDELDNNMYGSFKVNRESEGTTSTPRRSKRIASKRAAEKRKPRIKFSDWAKHYIESIAKPAPNYDVRKYGINSTIGRVSVTCTNLEYGIDCEVFDYSNYPNFRESVITEMKNINRQTGHIARYNVFLEHFNTDYQQAKQKYIFI